MTKIEVACFNEQSALTAAKEGADRIELCENYAEGGLTPKQETLEQLKANFSTPVFTMIRPVGGGFLYTDEEFAGAQKAVEGKTEMEALIAYLQSLGHALK